MLVYKIDPPSKYVKAAAYVQIELGEKRLERWLIVGEQQLVASTFPKSRSSVSE